LRVGLSSVLSGAPLEHALRNVPPSGGVGRRRTLTVLPAGGSPTNASDLIASDEMTAVLCELEERFEVVIVDSPPLGVAADALSLASAVSGVLVVCGVGRTTRDGMRELRHQLMLAGIDPLGVVANFATPVADDYRYRRSRLHTVVHG
jgi:polysaccharide biosynthesis transport protein